MFRRVEIEPHDGFQFFGKRWIVAYLERPHQMWLQAMLPPNMAQALFATPAAAAMLLVLQLIGGRSVMLNVGASHKLLQVSDFRSVVRVSEALQQHLAPVAP